jgi:hypothetical protein
MQGDWTITVKSSESFEPPQQYVVEGADTGNGTYSINNSTAPVFVSGDSWQIRVQQNQGSGFIDLFDQITFPSKSGNQYQFDIQTNNAEADPDFDDVVLTCSMNADFEDFLVFGNVSWYRGCWWNPCYPPWYAVIDTPVALANALQRPALRAALEQLYPSRVFPPNPNPPDPGPFRPMVIPVDGASAIPAKLALVAPQPAAGQSAPAASARRVALRGSSASASSVATAGSVSNVATASRASVSAAALVPIRGRLNCTTGPLPQYMLRFQEYDRTPEELAGGPYTGTGPRRPLGTTFTDRNGNYIFRFTMSLWDFISEAEFDTAPGENVWAEILPDVIVQVLDGPKVIYETAPYWNIPNLERINICVPWGSVNLGPGCTQGQIIQSIGNITVGPLVVNTRTTANTWLDGEGVVTSTSSLGPKVSCAAWAGSLYLYACLDDPAIVSYVITYKRVGTSDSTARFVLDDLSPYHTAPPPVYWIQQSVGPTPRNLRIDGTLLSSVPSYFNIETDPADGWMDRWLLLKATINSSTCEQALGGTGPIEFRIIGFNNAGDPVAEDRIRLYVDNTGVDQYISPTIRMQTSGGWVTQGNCALFTADPPDAPIEITFRSNQYEGFMDSYQLSMDKGATGNFPIMSVMSSGQITGSYAYGGDPLNCNFFYGTKDDTTYGHPTPDAVTADVQPASGNGNWLTDKETFCAFSINLTANVRITDGQGVFGPYYSGPILIGIQKA